MSGDLDHPEESGLSSRQPARRLQAEFEHLVETAQLAGGSSHARQAHWNDIDGELWCPRRIRYRRRTRSL
jgi:hypothetical protein